MEILYELSWLWETLGIALGVGIYCCNSGGYSGCPDTDAALRGGSTASDACSMQQYKFENRIFKLFIGGNTASNACCMHGCKNGICFIRKYFNRWLKKNGETI